ncbi:MAG: DUF885 family protein, partial [Pseudomonadota bacterium]
MLQRLALVACITTLSACAGFSQRGNDADASLRALYEAEYAWRQVQQGRIKNDEDQWTTGPALPSVTPQSYAERLQYWEEALARLAEIPKDRLSDEEAINAAVFEQILTSDASNARYRTYEAPLNSDTFFWSYLTARRGFADIDGYERYIGRMRDLPRYFSEHMTNMRAGLARGFTPPAVTLRGRTAILDSYLVEGENNPFFAPARQFSNRIPIEE